jgi:hypothetical protein
MGACKSAQGSRILPDIAFWLKSLIPIIGSVDGKFFTRTLRGFVLVKRDSLDSRQDRGELEGDSGHFSGIRTCQFSFAASEFGIRPNEFEERAEPTRAGVGLGKLACP